MGDVHRFPGTPEATARLLERSVAAAIEAHPDPRVAARWAAMARATLGRWPGPPRPSVPTLDTGVLEGLDATARARLLDALEEWMSSYLGDVNAQLLEIHRELLTLQRRVAELESEGRTA